MDPQSALKFSQSVVGKSIGDYTLTDREGRPVRLSQYRGKPLLVSFVYTGCFQVCPTTTRFLSKAVEVAQEAVGRDKFAVLSIGFNLPFDSPRAMKAFARRQGVDIQGWEFLSPDPATLARLVRDFGFSYVPTPQGFDHLTQVTIVDGRGEVFRQVYGDSFETPMLVGPLKELITGEPSPPYDFAAFIDKVRLLCTVYDARSGRYRVNYGLIIEIISGASILGAIAYILLSAWWRSRRLRST